MIARADRLAALGLLALGLALPPFVGGLLDLGGAAGTDPYLWIMTARNRLVDAPLPLPPLWPTLVHVSSGVGEELGASRVLAWLLFGAIGPAGFALARALGAERVPAALATALVLAEPNLLAFGLQAQPDALAALCFPLATGAALLWLRKPTGATLGGVFLAVALLPLVREQGLVLAALLIALLALAPGTASDRLLRLLAGAVAMVTGPLLLGLDPGAPWDQPWAARTAMATQELLPGALPGVVNDLPEEASEALTRAYEQGNRLTVGLFHLRWALGSAPVLWAAVGLALVASLRAGRRVALVGLLPVLPSLAIWSEPRHVAVALPVAGAALAAVCTNRVRATLGVLLGLSAATAWPKVSMQLEGQAATVRDLIAFGEALCAQVQPDDLGAGVPGAFLACPIQLTGVTPGRRSAADWKAWMVGEHAAPPGWTAVDIGNDLFQVYRLQPWRTGSDRPCAESAPLLDTPFFGSPPREAHLDPPCTEEVDTAPAAGDRPSEADDRPRVKPQGRRAEGR